VATGRVLVLIQVGSLRSPTTSTRPLTALNNKNTKFRAPTGGAFALSRLRIAPAETVAPYSELLTHLLLVVSQL